MGLKAAAGSPAGVAWRLHTWLESLLRAQQLCRREVTLHLLSEFPSIRTEDYGPELLSTAIPLMFGMMETSKVQRLLLSQLATAGMFGASKSDPEKEIL